MQETQEDSGLFGQLLCAFWDRNCNKNSDFQIKKTEMHDREANRTYRDCTAESKYMSAVGPSEKELLLNRKGLRPKWKKNHFGLILCLRSSFFKLRKLCL